MQSLFAMPKGSSDGVQESRENVGRDVNRWKRTLLPTKHCCMFYIVSLFLSKVFEIIPVGLSCQCCHTLRSRIWMVCFLASFLLKRLSVYRLHGGITFMCLGFCSPSRGWSLKTKLSGFILKHRQKGRIRTLHQQEHAQSIHFLRNDIRFISRNSFVSQPKKISLKARYKLKN